MLKFLKQWIIGHNSWNDFICSLGDRTWTNCSDWDYLHVLQLTSDIFFSFKKKCTYIRWQPFLFSLPEVQRSEHRWNAISP